MAVKRITGISPVVSGLDRRIKAVESGKTSLDPRFANAPTLTLSDDDDPNVTDPTDGTRSDGKYEYKRVLKAYIYGDKVTGNGSRCELYFSEDPQLEKDAPLDVQGVHGTSTENFNISPKQFKTLAVDSSPWNDDVRSTQSWRNTPTIGNNGDTITNTVWFNPVVEVPSSYPRTSGRELITSRRIDTVDIDGTTVTVNLNSTHKFELGDIISVDLPEPAFGIDGVFRISEVPDTSTIVYELYSAVSSPITLDSSDFTGGEAYVYPVARRYVKDGTVWIDDSVTPNRVWVWNVLRWYDTAEPIGDVSAVKDGIAPSPVTNLEGESQVLSGSTTPVIDLTWTPPTTRSNGTPISSYLSGYIIRYKRSSAPTWETIIVPDDSGSVSSYRITTGLEQNFTYNIEVYVTDIMSQKSTEATIDVVTGTYSEVLNPPAAPTVTSKLGTITVDWSGLDSTGNLPVKGVLFVEIHESTTSGFTPSAATLVESIPVSSGGNYAVLTGRLFDNTTFYYYKVVFVREINSTELVKSDPSAESIGIKVQGVTGPDVVAGSITTNNLEAGFVSAELFRGQSIIAQTVPATRRIEIKASGITAYPINSPSNYTFSLESNTGNVVIVGGTIRTIADANRGVEISPAGIVAKNSGSTNTFVVESSTGNVVITGGSLTSPTVTGGTIQTSASVNTGIKMTTSSLIAYNSGGSPTFTVDAGTGNVTLSGGTLTGPVVRSNAPVTGNAARVEMSSEGFFCFDASGNAPFRAYANGTVFMSEGYIGTLSANNITTGTLTGRSVQTSAAGANKRVLMSQASNAVIFYDSNGTEVGRMEGVTTGGGSLDLSGRGTASINIGLASTVVSGNLSTAGGANIFASGRLGQNEWALTGTRIGGVSYNNTGLLVPSASDQRLKTNIQSIPSALERILELNPVTFNWKTDDTNQSKVPGLIAQEVSQVFGESEVQIVRRLPEINPDPASEFFADPMMAVEYEAIIPYLIKAMQELSTKNEALEARLAALEGNG
jgi:hypothetical protein